VRGHDIIWEQRRKGLDRSSHATPSGAPIEHRSEYLSAAQALIAVARALTDAEWWFTVRGPETVDRLNDRGEAARMQAILDEEEPDRLGYVCGRTSDGKLKAPDRWPWGTDTWRPDVDPVVNLARAGALLAAEIDRLHEANPPVPRYCRVTMSHRWNAPGEGGVLIENVPAHMLAPPAWESFWGPLQERIANRLLVGVADLVVTAEPQWSDPAYSSCLACTPDHHTRGDACILGD